MDLILCLCAALCGFPRILFQIRVERRAGGFDTEFGGSDVSGGATWQVPPAALGAAPRAAVPSEDPGEACAADHPRQTYGAGPPGVRSGLAPWLSPIPYQSRWAGILTLRRLLTAAGGQMTARGKNSLQLK